jgi:hypothetical protein
MDLGHEWRPCGAAHPKHQADIIELFRRRDQEKMLAAFLEVMRLDPNTIQAQYPWITLFAVVIGGLIAGGSNLLLQWLSFRSQDKRNLYNERISAYNSLLGHISNYESVSGKDFIADMGLYLSRAFAYGTPEIKALIKPVLMSAQIKPNSEFNCSMHEISKAIIEEIVKEKKRRWQFWK